MSKYTDAVEHNLKGLSFVSTGICPGCDECRSNYDDYTVQDNVDEYGNKDNLDYPPYMVPAIDSNSFNSYEEAEKAAREAFKEAVSCEEIYDEGSFSWSGCGICGSHLGGTLYSWHGVDSNGDIMHFDDACTDCVMYLANGDEPDEWEVEEMTTKDE